MADSPKRPPEPMSDTVRHLERRAREISAHGDRTSRLGLLLILAGAAIFVLAVVGAILVNL